MTFALFRVAAGPRLGHGHLRRAEVLARALSRPAVISIRGRGAERVGLPIVPPASPGATLDRVRPRVLVIDDPMTRASRSWCRAARARAVPVVSLHDLGIAPVASDLAIDGSVVGTTPLPAGRELRGLRYAVLAPPVRRRRAGPVRRLLISLGGGPRLVLTRRLAAALHRRWPSLEIVATGAPSTESATGEVRWIAAPGGLAPWLARVDAAIVGGGLTLYETVAAGTPAIALAVVPAQRPTIRGFAVRGLALDGGHARRLDGTIRSVVRAVATLMADDAWRRTVAVAGPRAVDGRGATRAARAIAALVHGGTRA